MTPTTHMANKKRKWQRNKPKRTHRGGGGGGFGGGGGGIQTVEEVKVDLEALPADLNEEQLEELEESLPKSTRKTKPKPVSYTELQEQNFSELHEVAAKEKVEAQWAMVRKVASSSGVPPAILDSVKLTAADGELKFESGRVVPE